MAHKIISGIAAALSAALAALSILSASPIQAAPVAPNCPCVPDTQFTIATRMVTTSRYNVIVTNRTQGNRSAVLAIQAMYAGESAYSNMLNVDLASGESMTATVELAPYQPLNWFTIITRWQADGCEDTEQSPYVRLMFPVVAK